MSKKHDNNGDAPGATDSTGAETDLRNRRREYFGAPLRRNTMDADPFEEFAVWMALAGEHHPEDSTAMVLATADQQARPSSRTVLLKHFDQCGFCWYSNSSSLKGQQLALNPQAALQFYWRRLNRQVRISGTVEMLSRASAEKYFDSRPEGSRFSAAVSRQSSVVENRQILEHAVDDLHEQFPNGDIPCPEDWCGYRLQADYFEFWQGRENRLHDRVQYSLIEGEASSSPQWRRERLAP